MRCLGWIAALSLLAHGAYAHTLELATARVSLRDQHVDVAVELDVVALVATEASVEAVRLTEFDDELLNRYVQSARKSVEAGAEVLVEGNDTPLVLRGFPNASQIRALAAQASAGQHNHAEFGQLRYETAGPVRSSRVLAVHLPKRVGRVLYTFVQPTSRLVPAGDTASFEVLTFPQAPLSETGTGFTPQTGFAIASGLLAIVALLAQFVVRPAQRSEHREES